MSDAWQTRSRALLGETAIKRLKKATVVVVGLGGVGSYAFEAIVRSGVGHIVAIDHETVEQSNINRQLVADTLTIGKPKVDVAKQHGLLVNPDAEIIALKAFLNHENVGELIPREADVIIDAIDSINAKTELIQYAVKNDIPIISSMGTANKTDPTQFVFGDIYQTSVDPLAKVMRKRLKDLGIKSLPVVYSKESPIKNEEGALGSVSFVPSACGLILAAKTIMFMINNEWS